MRTFLFISIFCFLNACGAPPQKPSIGEQIRAARLQKGMSQAELAATIQMSQEALSRIEDGLADIMHTKIDTVEAVLGLKLEGNK